MQDRCSQVLLSTAYCHTTPAYNSTPCIAVGTQIIIIIITTTIIVSEPSSPVAPYHPHRECNDRSHLNNNTPNAFTFPGTVVWPMVPYVRRSSLSCHLTLLLLLLLLLLLYHPARLRCHVCHVSHPIARDAWVLQWVEWSSSCSRAWLPERQRISARCARESAA